MNLNCFIDDSWDEPVHMFQEYIDWDKKVKQNILIIEYLQRIKDKIEKYDDSKLLKHGYRYLNVSKNNITAALPHNTKVKVQLIDRYFYGFIYVSESVTEELKKWGDNYHLILYDKPYDSNDNELFNELFGNTCWILIQKENIFEII